jgi:hypothetical protein
VAGVDGRAEFVASNRFSIGVSLVSVARKIGATMASVVNNAGTVVQPTYDSVRSALTEGAVSAQRNEEQELVYGWTGELGLAPGPRAWPLVMATSLLLPRTFSRQECRARSELIKFLQWMLSADSVRYSLAEVEGVTLLSTEIDAQLGITDAFLHSLQCGPTLLNAGALLPLTISGPTLASRGVSVRALLMDLYSFVDSHTPVVSAVHAEDTLLHLLGDLFDSDVGVSGTDDDRHEHAGQVDGAWIVPATYPAMYDVSTAEDNSARTGRNEIHRRKAMNCAHRI